MRQFGAARQVAKNAHKQNALRFSTRFIGKPLWKIARKTAEKPAFCLHKERFSDENL